MKMLKTLISVVATALLIQFAVATNHTVGAPNGGWDDTTDLQAWASSQKFVVGDYIVFVYAPNHDVLEVSKADYDSCNPDNAITISAGGFTVIQLTTPGKFYFICGTIAHCFRGMKVEIDIFPSAAPPPPPTKSPPPPPPATPSTPPPPATPSIPPPQATPAPPTETPWSAPHAEPISAPVWSPSHSPEHSPAYAPETSHAPAPSKSHAKSPSKAPAHSPSKAPVSSVAPSISPSGISAPAPAPAPGSSAATKVNLIAGSALGFAFATMMLLTL